MAFFYEWAIMVSMRNFIALLLIFMIAMPSMVCAMSICSHARYKLPSCHTSTSDSSKEHKAPEKVMLLIDCMGVDMQKADTASIDKPDLKKEFVVYALADDAPVIQVSHTDEGTIRGPPPDWPNLHETQPSLILTTQRFRI
ncbi:MAG: hypothetical protein KJ017_08685 [Alphaproteobacteria bacterium]|nr:hypothetical protein [Alphaproteobacteria bacterium]